MTCVHSSAKLRLPSILSDNMVLQRDKTVCIWGKSDPGSIVTVEFAGQKKTTQTDKTGIWKLWLKPMSASSNPRSMKISTGTDGQNIQLSNILVGDVWLCSGQSNMKFPLFRTDHGAAALTQPANNEIRYFYQRFDGTPKPRFDCSGGNWKQDSLQNRKGVSAPCLWPDLQHHARKPICIGCDDKIAA